MLEALYCCRVKEIPDNLGGTTLEIDLSPLPEGTQFAVMSYARVSSYTLIGWKQGDEDEDEYATGETLWRDRTPIATTGGSLSLYSPPAPGSLQMQPSTGVWGRVEANTGNYGLPGDVAIALRDPINMVYL